MQRALISITSLDLDQSFAQRIEASVPLFVEIAHKAA